MSINLVGHSVMSEDYENGITEFLIDSFSRKKLNYWKNYVQMMFSVEWSQNYFKSISDIKSII